jgi:hypothetical protein
MYYMWINKNLVHQGGDQTKIILRCTVNQPSRITEIFRKADFKITHENIFLLRLCEDHVRYWQFALLNNSCLRNSFVKDNLFFESVYKIFTFVRSCLQHQSQNRIPWYNSLNVWPRIPWIMQITSRIKHTRSRIKKKLTKSSVFDSLEWSWHSKGRSCEIFQKWRTAYCFRRVHSP